MTGRVGIALNTKGKPQQVLEVLRGLKWESGQFDLWNFEGEPQGALTDRVFHKQFVNVSGGPDYAAVLALSELLQAPEDYSYVGIIEDDVCMTDPDWFSRTMELFDRGHAEGLCVGAVSARAYADRILIQRDGYAVMHNLGYGMIILTRDAAQIALDHLRTGMTSENRRAFCKLSGLDIGRWWAFGESEHMICADWGLEKFLAINGYAALALTPSPVEMIGQNPPLEHQGLAIVREPVAYLRNDRAFDLFVARTDESTFRIDLGVPTRVLQNSDGNWHLYPHQLRLIPSLTVMSGWRTLWNFGMGPFAFQADVPAGVIELSMFGQAAFLFKGGATAGRVMIEDVDNKQRVEHVLPPASTDQALEVLVGTRNVGEIRYKVVASPGVAFLRVRTAEQQIISDDPFTVKSLPPPA